MITSDDIRPVPLFAGLGEDMLRRLAARSADLRLRAGDWVVREGDPPAFFVVIDGCIAATTRRLLPQRPRLPYPARFPRA
jgi:thioredoxin reductase (NADPH)